MGKLKGITINTDPAAEAHICAEDDAAIYQSIVGSDGVMMIGQQCESQVISNNKVRVKDRVIVVGGHFARIQYGDYIDCEIANGQSGRNRNDIIIAKFVTTGTGGIDTYTVEVKQGASTTGAATDPALTQNDLYQSGKIREMPLYRVKIEGLSITKVEKMFESIPTIPMLNTYLSELQLYHDKKMLTPTDLGLNTGIWKTIVNNSYKTGNTIHLNMEIYTTAIIVANNVYNNAFTIPSQYRPLIDTAVNVTASDGEYKNPVACTSLAKANGNLFFCIPKATNNYIFIDAEWEIK